MTPLASQPALDDNLASRQAELAALIQRHCPGDGLHGSAIPGLDLACATTQPAHTDAVPAMPVHHCPGPQGCAPRG